MFLNIYYLIVCYVLFVLNVFSFVSVCAFARQFLSVRSVSFVFFLSVWISRCASAIFLALSLCWVIFSRLCVCYLSFVRFLLFIYWLILRSSRLFVAVSRSTNVLWLCGFVTYVYIIWRKRGWIRCGARAWVDDDNSVSGCRFPRLTGWRRLFVGVVFDINRLCCVLLTLSCLLVRSVLCFVYNFLFWVYSVFSVFLTVVFPVSGVSSTSMSSPSATASRRFSSSVAPLLLSGVAWFNSCKVSGCH